jgi:predicted alpha/beta-fold hydrolase
MQLQAAVAISAPFDLARASRYIGRGFGKVYENAFLRSLKPKAVKKIGRHPELSSLKPIHNARTIWEFDDEFTSPVHGFANAADYYAQSSSLQFLPGIRRPTLLLSAVDDPFLPPEVLDEVRAATASNRNITIDFPAHGGHVGFTGGHSPWRPIYYAEQRAAEFIAQQLRALHVPTTSTHSSAPAIGSNGSAIHTHAETQSHTHPHTQSAGQSHPQHEAR